GGAHLGVADELQPARLLARRLRLDEDRVAGQEDDPVRDARDPGGELHTHAAGRLGAVVEVALDVVLGFAHGYVPRRLAYSRYCGSMHEETQRSSPTRAVVVPPM